MTQSILYSSIRSPHCLKIGIVLAEKQIPFDRVEIDLRNRQQREPAYLTQEGANSYADKTLPL